MLDSMKEERKIVWRPSYQAANKGAGLAQKVAMPSQPVKSAASNPYYLTVP